MKPEHLLLLQNFAFQQSYQTRILETLTILLAKTDGMNSEMSQAFAKQVDVEADQFYQKLLLRLINVFQTAFGDKSPELSDLTPEELLKLLSDQNPPQSMS